MENVDEFLNALPEAERANARSFLEFLKDGEHHPPAEIQARLPDPVGYAKTKSTLYQLGLITSGKRNGKIRLKQDVQGESGDALEGLEAVSTHREADLLPPLEKWLRQQEVFEYIYAGGGTNIGPGTNMNPDILGVSIPDLKIVARADSDICAIEVKRSVDEFLQDKLLAEVATYTGFATYVYAAYFKPWPAMFQPAEPDEADRMSILERMGVGVFWITSQRSRAVNPNYRCIMVQSAGAGNPSSDVSDRVLESYQNRLLDFSGNPLPNLAKLHYNDLHKRATM